LKREEHVQKIDCIVETFQEAEDDTYIVWVDLDIYWCDMDKRLEEIMFDTLGSGRICDIVAQDTIHAVNSGFLFFRKSWSTKNVISNLLKDWSDSKCEDWVYDQGMFQNTLLHYAHQGAGSVYNNQCCGDLGWEKTVIYNDLCFKNEMKQLGYPPGKRTVPLAHGALLCLLPASNRWNMHDDGYLYQPGDVMHHIMWYDHDKLDTLGRCNREVNLPDNFIREQLLKKFEKVQVNKRDAFVLPPKIPV